MSELENAEKEARKWMREDTPVAPNSLYWSRVLSERDVLKGQLDAMEEALAAKDERIAELEREAVGMRVDTLRAKRATDYLSGNAHRIPSVRPGATLDDAVHDSIEALVVERDQLRAELERSRPVGDWPEARRLRGAWSRASDRARRTIADFDWTLEDTRAIGAALRAFCESQPPAPSPVREVVVESEAARKLREAWGRATSRERDVLAHNDWANLGVADIADALRDFCESAPPPPASAPSDEAAHYKAVAQQNAAALTECQRERDERTRQVAQLQDELADARYARDKAQSELAALKSAPARSEREVDAELRAALKDCCEWTRPGTRILHALDRWLAAPLSAEDEYTRAAVAYAEASLGDDRYAYKDAFAAFRTLYTARHSSSASAPEGEKAVPAPADGERVTVYVKQYAGGGAYGFYEQDDVDMEPARGDMRWLALDARVVREGGA